MDADFSHAPNTVRSLIRAAQDVDVVFGSRFSPGGSLPRLACQRELLSRGASRPIGTGLGIQPHDPG